MNIHTYIAARELEEEIEKIAMFGLFRKKTPLALASAELNSQISAAKKLSLSQRKKLDKIKVRNPPPLQIPKVPETRGKANARKKLMELKKKRV